MVDGGKIDASGVCVFEMTERVGGRLYSLRGLGPDGDLSVDAGGYRTVRSPFARINRGEFCRVCSLSFFTTIHSGPSLLQQLTVRRHKHIDRKAPGYLC